MCFWEIKKSKKKINNMALAAGKQNHPLKEVFTFYQIPNEIMLWDCLSFLSITVFKLFLFRFGMSDFEHSVYETKSCWDLK